MDFLQEVMNEIKKHNEQIDKKFNNGIKFLSMEKNMVFEDACYNCISGKEVVFVALTIKCEYEVNKGTNVAVYTVLIDSDGDITVCLKGGD